MDSAKENRPSGASAVLATGVGIAALYAATLGVDAELWLGVGEYAWFGVFWLGFALVQWYRLLRRLGVVAGT